MFLLCTKPCYGFPSYSAERLKFLRPNMSTSSDYLSPDYYFPIARMTPVMPVSFLLLEPTVMISPQGLCTGSLFPRCLLHNTLISCRSLLRTYLLLEAHLYHSIYFCNLLLPQTWPSWPHLPGSASPPIYTHFLTHYMRSLFVIFIIHCLSLSVGK